MGQGQSVTAKRMTVEEMDLHLEERCTRISKFTQRGFPGGMCHGMCLDWVRRILSGKTTRFNKYDGNPQGAEKRKQTMLRAHGLRAKALGEAVAMKQQEMKNIVSGLNLQTATLVEITKAKQDIGVLKQELIDITKMGVEHPVFWRTFAELWNASEKNKLGQKKQANFDSIQGALIGNYAEVDEWEAFFNQAVAAIPADKCAVVLIRDSTDTQASHAIAFHRASATTVEFFDPNFGEFTTASDKAGDVMEELMRNIYPTYDQACTNQFS